jgi:hypothetical protein
VSQMKLDMHECYRAALEGVRRRLRAMSRDAKQMSGYDLRDAWDIDIEGAMAEMVVAKLLGHYWSGDGPGNYKGADVSDNIQVRWTKHENGHLLVNERDNPSHFYFLVTGVAPIYELKGWIAGHKAKIQAYFRRIKPSRPPCYCVPQSDLEPLEKWNG